MRTLVANVCSVAGLIACVCCGAEQRETPPSGSPPAILRVLSIPAGPTAQSAERLPVDVNAAALQTISTGVRISMEIARGVVLTGTVTDVQKRPASTLVGGSLDEEWSGRFVFSVSPETVAGNIVSAEGEFELGQNDQGQVVLSPVEERPFCAVGEDPQDQPNLPDPAPGSPDLSPFAVESQVPRPADAEDGKRVDVLVLVSSAVAKLMTSEKLNQGLERAEFLSDETLKVSGIELDVRIVGTEVIEWTETQRLRADLGRLQQNKIARDLRDKYAADQVTLLRLADNPPKPKPNEPAERATAGIAYTMTNFNQGFSEFGYAVVAYSQINRGATFTHELGHTFGGNHDPDHVKNARPVYKYSFGHYFDAKKKQYGTMMSYVGTLILNFSNPDAKHLGVATGIANERDNAQTLRNTKQFVANFRKPPT